MSGSALLRWVSLVEVGQICSDDSAYFRWVCFVQVCWLSLCSLAGRGRNKERIKTKCSSRSRVPSAGMPVNTRPMNVCIMMTPDELFLLTQVFCDPDLPHWSWPSLRTKEQGYLGVILLNLCIPCSFLSVLHFLSCPDTTAVCIDLHTAAA